MNNAPRSLQLALLLLLAGPALASARQTDVVIEHLAEPPTGSAAFYHPAASSTVRVATGGMLRSAAGAPHLASVKADAWGLTAAAVGYEDLTALGDAVPGGPFLAANVRRSGLAPFASHVFHEVGGVRIAFLGITQVPPHAGDLIDLGGWELLDPAETLEDLVAEIAGQADLVILLAAMDRLECARLLRAVPGVHAALVASDTTSDYEALSVGGSYLVTSPVGTETACRLVLGRENTEWRPRSNELVKPRLDPADEARLREVQGEAGFADPASLFSASPAAAGIEIPLPDHIELGEDVPLTLTAQNRGAELALSSMRLLAEYGGRAAPAGHSWLVLHGAWRNIIPLAFAFERELPVTYAIPNPRDHFYVVVDGCRLGRLDKELTGGPGGAAQGALVLPRLGSVRSGNLVFALPVAEPPRSLELRFYDHAHGHVFLPLLTGELPADTPRDETRENRVLEAGVYGFEKTKTLGSRTAPPGTTFAVVDLRARSRFTFEADATAFDPKAEAGDVLEIGTVADWKETERYLQAVVDGRYAYGLEPETTLPVLPRFLPDRVTGERAVFLVPEEYTSLELRCDFPNAAPPRGEIFHPAPLVFPLEGERPAVADHAALLVIDDEGYARTTLTGSELRTSFAGEPAGADRKFLVLDVGVQSLSDKGELYQTSEHLHYVAADGSKVRLDETSGRGPYRTADVLYVPPDELRSFQAVFRIPADEAKPRLAYHGVSMAEVYDLPPLADVVAEAEVAAGTDSPPSPRAETTTVAPPPRPADLPALTGDPVPGFMPAAARGAGVELGVLDGRLTRNCLERTAAEGHVFLQLQILWRRLDPDQRWQSGWISNAFFLHAGGLSLEQVWGSCWGEEGFLPGSITLEGDEVSLACTVVFEVPDGQPLSSSSLVFMPYEGAPLVLPFVAPPANPSPLPVLARAENEILELTAHDFVPPTPELIERIGSNMPGGKELVCLRVSAVAKGRPVDLYSSTIGAHLQLVAEGSFPCPSFFWAGRYRVEGWPMWSRDMRLLPGVRDHSVLAFAVPKRDEPIALALELHLPLAEGPDGTPVAKPLLELPLIPGELRPPTPALAHMEEDGWEIEVLGLRRHGDPKRPEVALDVRVRTSRSGADVQFGRRMLVVRDQAGHLQSWYSSLVHPYEASAPFHLQAGSERRFDACFTIPDPGTYLWLQVPAQCPTRMVKLLNPWVPEERARLDAHEPLEVLTAPELEIVHVPPSLFPEPAPRGIEGAGLTGARVNEAIRRGARFLMEKHPEGFRLDKEDHILVILALLHSRELEKNPELLAAAIRCAEERSLDNVYDAALTLMTLAWLDPQRYRPRIQEIAQALVEAQGEAGGWSYSRDIVREIEPAAAAEDAEAEGAPAGRIDVQDGGPIAGWPGTEEVGVVSLERRTPLVRTGGDNSCSQYAVLGLQAAFRSGVHAPRETWERAAKWFLEGQAPGRGWGYSPRGSTTGSMTTAGLAGLSIASFHLDERPEEVETMLGLGVDWLARNFVVHRNPGSGGWHLYYLYGLERAGRLLAKEFFGPHEWYPEGASFLVDNQVENGAWIGDGANRHEIRDTAFALLFLTLATEKLGTEELPPTGPGRLTVLTPGVGGSVVFILDASGSMGADLGDETRFDAARRVVLEVLNTAGAGVEVALRVYGHRYPSIDRRANEDSELVVGFGPADRPELASKLAGLRFRGKTPLTFSLQQALEDLQAASSDTPRVVLLTDGAESNRRAKPLEACEALQAAGVRLDVVCLAMDNTDLLERMAKAGGGACYTASDAAQLLGALRTTVIGSVPFRVLDPEGKAVAAGASGTEVTLPAGPYTVEIDLPDGTQAVPAWVHQDGLTTLTVRAW